jgi:hypothetical protein
MVPARIALISGNDLAHETLDAFGDLPRLCFADATHFGAIRIAPSRRMTSPFSMGLLMIDSTMSANSDDCPRRLGIAERVLRLFRQRHQERRQEDPGRDRHDADAIAGEFARDRQRHADNAALGRGVGGLADLAVEGRDACGVDDDAALFAFRRGGVQTRRKFRQHIEGAKEIHIDDLREVLQRDRGPVAVDDLSGRPNAGAID